MLCELSSLLNLPSRDPSNFSLCACRSPHDKQKVQERQPRTYVATHSTLPPPDQVINTESQSILLRQFYEMGIQRDYATLCCCTKCFRCEVPSRRRRSGA